MLVLRDVRCYRRIAQLAHEIPRVVILVAAQRHALRAAGNPSCHIQRRIALNTETGQEITDDANRNADLAIFVLGHDHQEKP